jgi:hypothetical protein
MTHTAKVDFNAGVVAAGEAQIESTVTGNVSSLSTSEKDSALKDQSQIYLPINNALTKVGYVPCLHCLQPKIFLCSSKYNATHCTQGTSMAFFKRLVKVSSMSLLVYKTS